MTPLDIFFLVFYYINQVAIFLMTLQFIPQALFYLFFFLPRKHYPESTDYHRIAIIIAAHDEEETIAHTIDYLKTQMDYPKDLYDIYVCAHNCKDETAKKAREAGAKVYECVDPDKSHRCVAYPLRYMLQKIIEENVPFDFVIRLDADNLPCKSFLKEMNNSISAGCKIVRAYEAASNLRQNIWSEECALYYVKDSRIQNTFRQFVHSTAMTPGPGLTFTREIAERMDGWDCMSMAEDAEFTFRRLFEGYKVYFNCDAIVYEDQPASREDTKRRMNRLGFSLNKLFFSDGWRMIVAFFRTGNPMYLDMLLQVGFNPLSLVALIWFPLYYAVYAVLMLVSMCGVPVFSDSFFTFDLYGFASLFRGLKPVGNIIFTDPNGLYYSNFFFQNHYFEAGTAFNSWAGAQAFYGLLAMAVQVILGISLFAIFQSFIALEMDHRKLGLSWRLEGMWKGILLTPLFSLFYGFYNVQGILTRARWKIAKRNLHEEHILPPLPDKKKPKRDFTLSKRELRRYSGSWWKKGK